MTLIQCFHVGKFFKLVAPILQPWRTWNLAAPLRGQVKDPIETASTVCSHALWLLQPCQTCQPWISRRADWGKLLFPPYIANYVSHAHKINHIYVGPRYIDWIPVPYVSLLLSLPLHIYLLSLLYRSRSRTPRSRPRPR
jgi:hypothetical protein